MKSRELTISNSFSQAWQKCKPVFMQLVLVFVVFFLIGVALGIATGLVDTMRDAATMAVSPTYISLLLATLVVYGLSYGVQNLNAIGITRTLLNVLDSKTIKVSQLFEAEGVFWRYFFTSVVYGLIILGGLILFIVPGIIWAIKYGYAPVLVIDKKLALGEALAKSSEITMGHKGWLFGLTLVIALANIAGFLALVVGLLFTLPLTAVVYTYVYRQLLGSK